MIPRPSPRPLRPRRTPTSRVLLLCGVSWIALCWSYVLFTLWSSLPHHATTAPSAGVGDARHHPLLSPPTGVESSDAAGKPHRHLSRSGRNATNGVDFGHRIMERGEQRPRARRRPPPLPADHADPAPRAPFAYPLHARSGTHHAHLYVGTPPQRQTLIVDTGSRLTAFPCRPGCPDCGEHASPPFQLEESSSREIIPCDQCKLNRADFELEEYFFEGGVGDNSGDEGPLSMVGLRGAVDSENGKQQQQKRRLYPKSCVNNQCELDQRYTEGSSWKAFEVQDDVWLGSGSEGRIVEEHAAHAAPHVFGCQMSLTGMFKSQYADGIMGLSMYTQTLVGSWTRRGSIPRPTFSLCLNQKGGHIALGGVGSSHGDSPSWEGGQNDREHGEGAGSRRLAPMQFTPFAKRDVWYYTVSVTSISVGEHALPRGVLQFVNDHKGTIVDSGTTDTFITHKVAKPFARAWERITGRRYNNRLQKYTSEQFDKLPIITFELEGGISWEIRPEAYMEESSPPKGGSGSDDRNETAADDVGRWRWDGERGFTSRVYVDEPQGVVLGSNAMMDKEVYFDVPNRRLGVAKATCAF